MIDPVDRSDDASRAMTRPDGGVSALVLHVLPSDLARGAQVYARDLRDALDGDDARHRTLALFRSPAGPLQPDYNLNVPAGWLRRAGFDPRVVAGLRRFVRMYQPAVVVVHGGEPLKYAVLAGVARRNLVYYKIGTGGTLLNGISRQLHRVLLGRTGAVAAVSDDAADEARSLGVRSQDLRVIVNGRDPAVYRQPDRTREGDLVRLVFVGHLTESKRPGWFIDVVRTLRDLQLPIEASMAGDGPLREALEPAARDAGVQLLGRVHDVPSLLSRHDALVFTSVSTGEGMPGVLIEAGMAGLPVVTTDVPGARAVVEDGKTGCIVPVDDFGALVQATRRLVGDAELRTEMGDNARQRCANDFSLEASFASWRTLLADVRTRACTSPM
jgi:glycosyltransferase involved in cell wall biosynthesis